MKFYNRDKEIEILLENEKQAENSAVFTVLMGRRRIGKTSLVLRALEGKPHVYLFVSRDGESVLCTKFQQTLEEQLGIKVYGKLTKFADLFRVIMEESQHRHFTVVMDEFQTLYAINPSIFSEIQDLWDRYHNTSKLNFIACGSILSLMKRIFEEKGEPLYGRPTSKFMLKPFSISVIKEILHDYYPNYSNEDLLCLYMITGGVAKYIELLIDAQCYTKTKMLNYVCRQDSYFLTEGRDLMNQEFGEDCATYYSIMQLIANGITRRAEIDGAMQRDVGTYLGKLEHYFGLISKLKPVLSKPNGKVSSYEVSDPFLRFWFRFICPYQSLVERQQFTLIRQNMERNYEQFSGRTLEQYYQAKMMESGDYSIIGNWWDRKGTSEIDIVALNEFTKEGIIAEVKRQSKRLDMKKLEMKMSALPASSFGNYNLKMQGLSLEDM